MLPARFLKPAISSVASRSLSTVARSYPNLASRQIYNAPLRMRWSAGSPSLVRQAGAREYRRQAFNYQRFQATTGFVKRWAARPTFYYEVGGIGMVCGAYYVYNLEPVPISKRMRFNVISPAYESQTGRQLFQDTMQQYSSQIMPAYTKEHQQVQRVLDRLIPHSGLEGEEWEIHVIDDAQKNAFVIPGGKVFVFRGILDICGGDDGLATVLGHEIAHNVAHHAAERMSQAFILLPIAIIGSLLTGVDPGLGRILVNLAFLMPGSRKQEAEADYIGLMMMAESCYNPAAALGLWARMEQEEKNASWEFLNTHPSNHNRLEKIRGWLDEASVKRENGECGTLTEYADNFRKTARLQWV